MDVDRLIDSVRRHVFLYDLNHNDYKNVTLKAAVWESIGMELNQNAEAVKNKWKTIRDGYTKYKKLLKRTSGSCRKNIQYMWSSQLSFLDDYNNAPRKSASNNTKEISPSPSPPPNQDSDHSQDYIPGTGNQSSMLTLPPSQVLSLELLENVASTSNNQTSRRNKRNDMEDLETMANFLNKKKKREYDGIDHLFLSYAETFKKFPPREQALLKLELAKLFTDTELRLIDSNTNGTQSQYAASFFKNEFN